MKDSSKIFILTTMLLLSISASAQERSWQVILCYGDTLIASRLDSLRDDVLSATWDSVEFSVPVDSIAELVRHGQGRFLTGAGIGAGIGAVGGAVVGAATYQEPKYFSMGPGPATFGGALIGAFGGFFVGGFVGELFSVSETYNLRGNSRVEKLRLIENLIAE